jgi:5-carboxymethyl-2-hydroxymuconate isomerase
VRAVDSADGPAVVRALSDPAAAELGEPFDSAIGLGQFAPPIARPGKIIAVGLNYADHIRETGATAPERPILFAKFPSAMVGPYDGIVVDPELTKQGDYEVELGVVIGKDSRRIPAAEALDHVFGYLVANDVSARDWQKLDGQLSRSKSMDTFLPIGPWVTTADEVGDPNDLTIRSTVNGELRQDSTTAEMIFTVAELIEFCSRTMTLEAGDIILTGTPHGVGFAMDPPRFLAPGDVIRCEIEGLGHIENTVT